MNKVVTETRRSWRPGILANFTGVRKNSVIVCRHSDPAQLRHVRTNTVKREVVVECSLCGERFDLMDLKRLARNTNALNKLTRQYTCFSNWIHFIDSDFSYTPVLPAADHGKIILADVFDIMQSVLGQSRRAYRGANRIPFPVPANTKTRNHIRKQTGLSVDDNGDDITVVTDSGIVMNWDKLDCTGVWGGRHWPLPVESDTIMGRV